MGDLPQNERLQVIEGIKTGSIKYLVATEVAARGLHIDDLELVINYDLPAERESYVHRIGRTARAGRSGRAISFACDKYVYGLEAIESFTKMKIPVVWADDALFEKDKSEGMTFRQPKGDRMMKSEGRASVKTKHTPARKGTESSGKKPRRVSRGDRNAHTRTGQDKSINREQTGTAKISPVPRRRRVTKQSPQKTVSRPGKNSTPEERIAYYKKKYGENFTSRIAEAPPPANQQKPKRKKSLLKKIREAIIEHYTYSTNAGFPWGQIYGAVIKDNKIYIGIGYTTDNDQGERRGICIVDFTSHTVTYERPTYATYDDYYLYSPILIEGDTKILCASWGGSGGAVEYDIATHTWRRFDGETNPGLSAAVMHVAYDDTNNVVFQGNYGNQGVYIYTPSGNFYTTKYMSGTPSGGSYTWGGISQLSTSYPNQIPAIGYDSNGIMYAMWLNENIDTG